MNDSEIEKKFKLACKNQDLKTINELLPNVTPKTLNLVIHRCCIFGRFDVVKELIKDPRIDPSYRLIAACASGDLKLVKELLNDREADPKFQGSSSLKLAVQYGHLEIVDVLLKDGRADPDDEYIEDVLLALAAERGHFKVVDRLLLDNRIIPNENNNEAIVKAFENNNFRIVDRLLAVKRIKRNLDVVDDPNFIEYIKKKEKEQTAQELILRSNVFGNQSGIPKNLREWIFCMLTGGPFQLEFETYPKGENNLTDDQIQKRQKFKDRFNFASPNSGAERLPNINKGEFEWVKPILGTKKEKKDAVQRYRLAADNGIGPTFTIIGNNYHFQDLKGYNSLADIEDKNPPNMANLEKNVLTTIDKLHKLKICHSDLHAGNILINPKTEDVKLIDFETCYHDECNNIDDAAKLELENILDGTQPSQLLQGSKMRKKYIDSSNGKKRPLWGSTVNNVN